jgi:hypothetical protein
MVEFQAVNELRSLAERTAAAFQAEVKRIGNVPENGVIAGEMLREIDAKMDAELAALPRRSG